MKRESIRYGPGTGQVAEVWRPAGAAEQLPVVVLIHGGFWRQLYTKQLMHRLARAVIAWGKGATLDTVLRDTDVAPGDFVRNVRQVIDLVRQLAQVAGDPATRQAADLAVALLRRGVVGADDPAAPGSALDLPVPT